MPRAEQRALPGLAGDQFPWPKPREIRTTDGWNPVIVYKLVQDAAALDEMLHVLRWYGGWSWDTETTGLKPELGGRVCGHAFGVRTGDREFTGWYLPIRHIGPANEDQTQLPVELVSDRLRPLFTETRGQLEYDEVKLYHGKFDRKMARADGIELRRPYADVGIAATTDNENEHHFKLKALAEKYCTATARGEEEGMKKWMQKDARGLGLSFDRHSKPAIKKLGGVLNAMLTPTYKQRFGYSRTPIRMCGAYAVHDVFYTWWLLAVKYRQTRHQYPALWAREHAISDRLLEMEWLGLEADEACIRDTHERVKGAVEYWLSECRRLAPGHIDETFEASDSELRELLYEKLKLEPPKYTKKDKKPSADKEARKLLEHSYPAHAPLLKAMNELATVQKMASTYTAAFLRHYSPVTKSIHPSYNQLEQKDEGGVPVTGRLSSSEPNGQNVTVEAIHFWDCHCKKCLDEEAKAAKKEGRSVLKDEQSKMARTLKGMPLENTVSVRRYFTVPKGHIRVFIDYSQIELRVLAWFCQDPNLVRAYVEDLDVHQMVADQLGITRKVAKQVNFGNSYGMTEIGLALRMPGYYGDPEGTREEAERVLERYFKQYPRILQFRREFSAEMRRNGCMFVNPFGRPRRIPEIAASGSERWMRERAERRMMSSIISGTSADLMKEAMLRVHPIVSEFGGRHVQSIHDENNYDLPLQPGWARTMIRMVRTMEDWPMFSETKHGKHGVPIKVNVALSTTCWEDKRELKIFPDDTFAWAAAA